MAKSSGLGDQLFVGGYDIGADINSIGSLATPRETLPGTAITQSAQARLFGKRDGMAEFTSYLNPSAAQEHVALSGLPRTDVHVMYLRGQGVGSAGIGLVGKQISYDPSRGDDGSLMIGTSVQANAFGIDWGKQLTEGKATAPSAEETEALNTTASASFGWQAYLQVFSLGSGTATVTLEDSADDITYDPLTDGAFTNVTAQTVQRLQSSSATATVRQYLHVAVTGTFTDLVYCVLFTKNKNTRTI